MKNTFNKVTKSARRNFKALCNSLVFLMNKEDLDAISVIDLCKDANVPRATFYNHFEDKYDLLRYFFSSKIEKLSQELKEKNLDSKEMAEDMIYEICLFISNNDIIFDRMLRSDNSVGVYEIHKVLQNVLLVNFTRLSDDYNFTIPLEPLCDFYAGAILFAGKWWLDNDKAMSYNDIILYLKKLINVNNFAVKK